jgi:alpha-glucoside transport system substrate-binding protein
MRRTRPLVVVTMALLLAVPAAVSAQDDAVDVSGTSFTLFGAPVSVEGEALQGFLDVYNSVKGTDIKYTGSDSFESELRMQVEGGNPPEIAETPQPGTPCAMAKTGQLASLEDMGFDIAEMEARHSKYWMDLVKCEDGNHYGLPWFPNFKSIVFYHKPTFEQMGYGIPSTYEELVALSQKIVDDGMTPWCFGFGSGADTGWPGTDWVEDIMLRMWGSDVYEQWYKHEIPFNDERVVAAFDKFGEILFGDGFVLGGAENVENIDFRDSPGPLFQDNPGPGCLMLRQGSFITNYFATQPDYTPGEESEIGVFTFPTVNGNGGAEGGGDTLMVFNPTPQNIQVVKDWTSPDWLCTLASPNGGGIAPYGGHGVPGVERLPGDVGVDLGCYDTDTAKAFATAVEDALATNTFVFDGGDLMPPSVGQGTFWTGLVDWSKGEPTQQVVDAIEASWPTSQ